VITGFRVARGGAQERYGVTPDLTVLGKIVGGGLPAAAFGGRADLMARLAPSATSIRRGRSPGTRLRFAAGISVLRRLREPSLYEELEARGARLEEGLRPFGAVQRVGAMLTLSVARSPSATTRMPRVPTRRSMGRCSAICSSEASTLPPSQFECMFVSLAHGAEEIDRTIEAVGDFFGN
jgi:glutamate-1-semialdehyde 2,1-aminomutase